MKGTRTGLQSRNITGYSIGPGAIFEVTFPNPFDALTYLAWLRLNGLKTGCPVPLDSPPPSLG